MKFDYQAFDTAGKSVSGQVDAVDAAEANETLRRQGLYVTKIEPARLDYAGTGGGARRSRRIGRGRLLKNLAMFTRQLSVLMTSGTPLVQALGALERQSADKAWRN